VAVTAAAGGALTALAGLHPTGVTSFDPVLTATTAAVVVAGASTAPWWAAATACVLAAALAPGLAWAAMGLAGAALAACGWIRPAIRPWTAATATVVALNVLARMRSAPFPGGSALIGLTIATALLVLGAPHWSPSNRRRARWALAGGTTLTLAFLGAAAVAGWSAAGDLRQGSRATQQGLGALERGDLAAAAAALTDASVSMGDAGDRLGAWWAQPARTVPVLSQHLAAAQALTEASHEALARSAEGLGRVDPDALHLVGGRIDPAAVTSLADPLREIGDALGGLARTIDDTVRSPWLAGAVTDRIAAVQERLERNRTKLDHARDGVAVAPALLGAGGQRRYLVAFLHPGEARGLGGHMGNFAEVTVTDGAIAMSRFGRSVDLNRGGSDPNGRVLTGPDDFLRRWGPFGFRRADGTTDQMPWSNITMAPDLPTVGRVMAELYPQSGGEPIDGVFVLFPEALAALMRTTGPVKVPGLGVTVTADNLVDFIEKDQYAYYDGSGVERIDALEQIALATVDRLLAGRSGGQTALFDSLRPLAADGRVMAWSARADEQAFFDRTGVSGRFPALNGADGIAVTVDNGGANKLDAYLGVVTDYRATVESAAGPTAATATATIALTNTVDPTGKPDYAVGNPFGLPAGTNRLMLSLYSALRASSIRLDGEAVTVDGVYASVDGATVFGWHVATLWLDIPPGTSRVVTVELEGVLDDPSAPVVIRRQPMALPQRYEVERS